MANYNSIEKIISAEILRTNEDNLLANTVCNTEFVGDIKNRGDSVTFIGLNDPTVYDYEGSITYEDIDDSSLTLLIDQDKAFSFKIKDIEAPRSSIDLEDSRLGRTDGHFGAAFHCYEQNGPADRRTDDARLSDDAADRHR